MRSKLLLPSSLFVLAAASLNAQSVGTVPLADANVVNAGPAVAQASASSSIGQNSLVVAKDHTAPITLTRGGEIHLCQTTSLHVTSSPDQSMLLAVGRGALELRLRPRPGDTLMTPDLQITFAGTGPLALDMRVTTNGDTCIENHGHRAPILNVSDLFGQASYQIRPGQHILFEHGSLREVVDKETTPCGCPPDPTRKSGSLADAALAGGNTPAEAAAVAHPFPAAVSQGLAEPASLPVDPPGSDAHVQVATTLAYDPDAPMPAAQPVPKHTAAAATEPTPAPKRSSNPLVAIGHFFKRIFVR